MVKVVVYHINYLQETLIVLNNLKGGTDNSKRKALKGFHIPKRRKTSNNSIITPEIKLAEDKSNTEILIEPHADVPSKHRVEDDDEPFYEDFKRKRPARRVNESPGKEYLTVFPPKNNIKDLKNEHETYNTPIVKDICSNIRVKKKDPPLRKSHIISAQPPEISSEEDIEEELRNILVQKLKHKKSMHESREKHMKITNIDISSNSKRKVVRYTRSSYAKNDSVLDAKRLPNVNPQNDSKYQKWNKKRFRNNENLVLNTTPDNPPTPPLIHNEDDEKYERQYIEENVDFSPNTSLSGFDPLNNSVGGSASERNTSSSIKADAVDREDKNSKKPSQELNSSCKCIRTLRVL